MYGSSNVSFMDHVFGARALRDAHMVTFFFRRFRDVPIFQTCEANFSKSRTVTVTIISLKVAQDPRLHGFFSKEVLKKRYF